MRGLCALLLGLSLRAGIASAADVGEGAPLQALSTRAVAAWPGFVIHMSPALAALAPAGTGSGSPVDGLAQSVTDPSAACLALTIAPRALTVSTAKARDGLIAAVRAAESRHRLPAGLLDSVVLAESAYRPRALSHAGAVGLTQLMPGTAQEVEVADRRDTNSNIEGGAKYLRRMIERFGAVRLALAAYNAGPSAVTRAGGVPDNGETPGYVARVVRLWRAVAITAETSLPAPNGKER